MPDMVRQAIDPKHRYRIRPFAVWVGGPNDGEPEDIEAFILKSGSVLLGGYEYPIREVQDETRARGWRVYYGERVRKA